MFLQIPTSPTTPLQEKKVLILYGRHSEFNSVVHVTEERAEVRYGHLGSVTLFLCVCVCEISPVDCLPMWPPSHSSLFTPHA